MTRVSLPVSHSDAVALASAEVERMGNGNFVLVESHEHEVDVGWVFSYQSARYIETGSVSDALAGNGPLLVDRRDGSVHHCWSGESWEDAVERYRTTGRTLPPSLGRKPEQDG